MCVQRLDILDSNNHIARGAEDSIARTSEELFRLRKAFRNFHDYAKAGECIGPRKMPGSEIIEGRTLGKLTIDSVSKVRSQCRNPFLQDIKPQKID